MKKEQKRNKVEPATVILILKGLKFSFEATNIWGSGDSHNQQRSFP
jgi:hypothetical protein